MSHDKLEIQFVLFAMLRIDYKCISWLMLIRLAPCLVFTRKKKHEGVVLVALVFEVLFVILVLYLAAAPQAVGIWLMIIRVRIRSLFQPESHSHIVSDPAHHLYSLSACTFKSDSSQITQISIKPKGTN